VNLCGKPKVSTETKPTNAWVLLSGGVDSTACVAFYLEQKFCVAGAFVDYSQAAASCELNAAKAVAQYYRIPLRTFTWSGGAKKGDGEVVGRNAFLALALAMELGDMAGIIAAGIHSGTRYYDCSGSFLSSLQGIIDGYTDGRLRIGAPFLDWDKRLIWEYCMSHHVPVELTYSCEKGTLPPCGTCNSCRDLEALRAL
jgi:7-cyano-7-deazaguanine synthase